MLTWGPVLLALVLVTVEARRQLAAHWRRERWRALLARSTRLTVGLPEVFRWSVGMDVEFFLESWRIYWDGRPVRLEPFEAARGNVVKIDYSRGLMWVADV